jgi:hypothetical protein
MTFLRQIPRTPWVALAAIVGLLLAAEDASACTEKGASATIPSCCINRPSQDCGCCSSPIPSTSPGMASAHFGQFEWALPVAWVPAPLSGSPCQCRSGAPTDSASKPDRNTVDQRSEQRRAEISVPPVFHGRPSVRCAAIDLQESTRLQFPLSLLTTHLLI